MCVCVCVCTCSAGSLETMRQPPITDVYLVNKRRYSIATCMMTLLYVIIPFSSFQRKDFTSRTNTFLFPLLFLYLCSDMEALFLRQPLPTSNKRIEAS